MCVFGGSLAKSNTGEGGPEKEEKVCMEQKRRRKKGSNLPRYTKKVSFEKHCKCSFSI